MTKAICTQLLPLVKLNKKLQCYIQFYVIKAMRTKLLKEL